MEDKSHIPAKLGTIVREFSKLKRRVLKYVWLVRLSLIVGFAAAVYLIILLFGFLIGKSGIGRYIKMAGNFIFTPASQVKSQAGRTNILILGKAGVGHNSPDLTDSLIFASLSFNNPAIDLVSLPRDIWIPEIRAKINSAYYWGKQQEEGGGLRLAKSLVEEISGQPVHYGLVVDFSGFTGIVDVVGGIQVDIERSFIDEKYPIPGKENDECGGDKEFKCRYEIIKFEKGMQTLNGEMALKFVRSRNAVGEEGTDLARAARQQKVLVAIKEKVMKPAIYLSPGKLLKIWKVVKNSIETDMDVNAAAVLARKAFNARNNIVARVLSEEMLIHPPISPRYDNQYVFIPKAEGWGEIHKWFSCLLESGCQENK